MVSVRFSRISDDCDEFHAGTRILGNNAPPVQADILTMRRFPPPWTVEALDGGFKVLDANKQALAYVYGHADARDAEIAKSLTLDEARRIAANIAKLPTLLGKE
jgi:hypothetical protein